MHKLKDGEIFAAYKGSDLPTLLSVCPWFVQGHDCVVTSIDSDTSTLYGAKKALDPRLVRNIGSFAVIRGDDLIPHIGELFTGFDELYVLRSDSWHGLDPSIWSEKYTSEHVQLDAQIPDKLIAIFESAGALRYASDGCGLNVLVRDIDEMTRIRLAVGDRS